LRLCVRFAHTVGGQDEIMGVAIPLAAALWVIGLGVLLILAAIVLLSIVFRSGTHADSLPGEEPPETMAHMRGPGI
jgi:hypothetical protein